MTRYAYGWATRPLAAQYMLEHHPAAAPISDSKDAAHRLLSKTLTAIGVRHDPADFVDERTVLDARGAEQAGLVTYTTTKE